MKRAADNQLTKDSHDDGDDSDDEVAQPTQGFQKADESALATRQIRALPKRALAGAAVKATSHPLQEPSVLPKFASFAGFGAGTSTPSSPFTFTVQPPTTAPTPSSVPPSSAGFNLFSIPKPSQSSTSSDSPNGTLPKQSARTTGGENGDATALKYYKSLRGLNVSFLSAISKVIEQDPFADVAGLLESYKNLRMTVQSEFDNASKSSVISSSIPAPSTTTTTPAPVPQFTMPKPPSAFPSLSTTATTSATSTSSNDSRFSFGASPAARASAFSFPPATPPSSAAPSFVPSTTSDSSTKIITPSNPSASIFGSSGDGGKPPLPTPPTGSGTAEAGDKPDASKEPAKPFTISLFGSSVSGNASNSLTGSAFSSEQPISGFGASPQTSSIFGFGKPAGSIGNPVGFGFGALAPKASDSGPTGFLKSLPAVSPPPTENSGESTPQPEGNEESPPAEDDAAKSLTTGGHDEEGEGEEDEETMHAVRCKVFRLAKTEDRNEWRDLGIGTLRLKKHKENNTRRVLMRNSLSGRILINFRLFSDLKPSLAKTSISFVGHENGAPASYRIRVKTEEQAVSLKHAMDREIAASQATS
ncbi:hypothetical protein EDD16DRAFT_1469342 [Pisolithus croceorrhizus]|nr:hypothetical protein EDD16DRAFT_1469342 [Pisolithus croceorrhizus]KAI6166149.1 hypothetical protein EDD17DRAFT_1471690 [Pisolithus thermaeus]